MVTTRINKRGQVAIWVIVALALIAGLILLFLFRKGVTEPEISRGGEDPQSYLRSCADTYTHEAVDLLLPQGGFIAPRHSALYLGKNISYLCYHNGNYDPCVQEHPLLIQEIREEIQAYVTPKMEECFQTYQQEMERRNAVVTLGEMALAVDLAPENVFVEIDRTLTIEKQEQSSRFEEFSLAVDSPVYDLTRVALEISSQEAEYCYFEYGGYMILYPAFKISRDVLSDSTEIYTLHDKKSGKEMRIAIRSCAIPPGF